MTALRYLRFQPGLFTPIPVSVRGLVLALTLILGGAVQPVSAQPEINRSIDAQGKRYYTPPARLAVERGLQYLAERQHPDGSFGSGSTFKNNVAITALCGMAFLGDGMRDEQWSAALRRHYGINGIRALQNTWVAWVRQGSPELDKQRTRPGAGSDAVLLADAGRSSRPKPNLLYHIPNRESRSYAPGSVIAADEVRGFSTTQHDRENSTPAIKISSGSHPIPSATLSMLVSRFGQSHGT